MTEDDPYPSRLDDPVSLFPRHDPVVHSRHERRWHGPLDEVSLSRYERDGFLWFEGFFSQERIAPFFDELAALAEDPQVAQSDQVIRDPVSGALRSVFAMHRLSRYFDELTRDPRLLGMARQLLGGDVYIHQSRINSKTSFQGSGFNWHSDFETWHAEDGMPRMRALSASLMLTENNEFNGPLMLIPGSHQYFVPCVGRTPPENWKRSLQSQQVGVPRAEDLEYLAGKGGIQAPKGPPGSLLLFECNVLHASNSNLSPWPRANLFFVYNSIGNQLGKPYASGAPRPEYLGTRGAAQPLQMQDDVSPWQLAPRRTAPVVSQAGRQ